MVSIKDIASVCGVSIATVSKALNDHKDVSESTKAMIRETVFRQNINKFFNYLYYYGEKRQPF